MRTPTPIALALLPCLAWPSAAAAQGTRADYQRAAGLGQLFRGKVRNARPTIHWLPGEARLVHSDDTADGGRTWWLVDAESGAREPLLGAAVLSELAKHATGPLRVERVKPLGEARFELHVGGTRWLLDRTADRIAGAPRQATDALSADTSPSTAGGAALRLEFENARDQAVELVWLDTRGQRRSYGAIGPGERRAQSTFEGHNWLILDDNGQPLGAVRAGPGIDLVRISAVLAPFAEQARPTPDAPPERELQPIVRGAELFLRDSAGVERALGRTSRAELSWEERFDWSPDGTHFVAWERSSGGARVVHYVLSAPRDQLQPKLESYPYLKPGDPIPQSWPRLFDARETREIPVSRALFENPWSIDRAHWDADSARFTFLYNQRGHQLMRLVAIDAATGQASALIDERCATFFDYASKLHLERLERSGELLWMSERSGWNHLYRIDARSGAVLNAVTSGPWVVRGVERVDEKRGEVLLRISGRVPDQDPYHVHFARASLDGRRFVPLTEGDGTHEVELSPDSRFLVARRSRVDLAPISELRRASDGRLVAQLARADTSALASAGWRAPERFVAKGRDGVTDIHGIVHRPTNFDPSRKYPVVEQIYAGPQDAHVPKSFREHHGHASELAELGFIVVQIDGMGTNWRSKAFHDVAWKNLADAGFPDRIAWLKALAAQHPEVDLTRVGIYGGSAGGQNALRALLDHGDFYSAAVADCGCHDNRMDKLWWNELWMSWPVGPHYEASSNVAHAARMQGELLLIVGEADENVDPASTMQVVDALVRADKDFELLVIPGAGHGAGGSPYGWRRTQDFFVRKLWRREPRAE